MSDAVFPFLGIRPEIKPGSVDLDQGCAVRGLTGLRSYVAGSLPPSVGNFHQPFFPRSLTPTHPQGLKRGAGNETKYCQARSPHQSKALRVSDNRVCEQQAIFFSIPEGGGPHSFLTPSLISVYHFFLSSVCFSIRNKGTDIYTQLI